MQGCVQGSASLCDEMRCGAVGWHERGQAGSHLHEADNVNGGLLLTVSLAPECQRRDNKQGRLRVGGGMETKGKSDELCHLCCQIRMLFTHESFFGGQNVVKCSAVTLPWTK